ncbi:MAG: DsbA family protein [Selenomonadaceae bacterium]|nr:DsbA family protein [Selenomonadaceae bacterium]
MDKISIMTFTDPMMGLSYECEPIFRKLETHFLEKIEFRYVMSGLVRSVYDLVDPNDLPKGNEVAIRNYNVRLAKIYEGEESIMGMPINMTNFQLFSSEHTSSIPLNLAYKAAELADKEKADLFLYNLRYATIVDCRPTTRREEIIKVVGKTGIDTKDFLWHFDGETAKKALESDFALGQKYGLRSLPSYLFEYGEKRMLVQGLIGYDNFVEIIAQISLERIKPQPIPATIENIRELLKKHPLISPIEIREAFDLRDTETVRELLEPLISDGFVKVCEVYHGWFIEKTEVA